MPNTTKNDQLQAAVENVLEKLRNGETVQFRIVAADFGIAVSTLFDRVRKLREGHVPLTKSTVKRYFTDAEEKVLSDAIKLAARQQLPVSRRFLLELASEAVCAHANEDRCGLRETPKTDDFELSTGWVNRFLQRHSDLAMRVPQATNPARTIVTEGRIRQWFVELTDFENEAELDGALQDPSRIFNCDEIGVPQGLKSQAVLAPKGMVNVVQKVYGSDRKHTTVLVAV